MEGQDAVAVVHDVERADVRQRHVAVEVVPVVAVRRSVHPPIICQDPQACPETGCGRYPAPSSTRSASDSSRSTAATASVRCAGLVTPTIGAVTADWWSTQA